MRKFLLIILGALLIGSTFAATPTQFVPKEGVDYSVIPNVKLAKSHGKINVKEFFLFTCIHCKDLEPFMQKFVATNKNVQLDMIYTVWDDDPALKSLAKLNATLVMMKADPKMPNLYIPVFNAIFAQQNLTDPTILKAFLAKNGLNSKQIDNFFAIYNSFGINSKVGEYKQMVSQYNITGTPTIIVGNKYVVSPAFPNKLIQVTDYLVNHAN